MQTFTAKKKKGTKTFLFFSSVSFGFICCSLTTPLDRKLKRLIYIMTTVWRLQGRRTDMYRDSDSDKRYVERMRKEKVGDDSNTSVTLGLSRHRQCVSLPCSPAPLQKQTKQEHQI